MNQKLQAECRELIVKYQQYKQEWRRAKVRNEVYLRMKPWMIRWVKSILQKWGKFESKEKLLSLSWEAFYFCLKKYDGANPHLAKYIYDFTRYFLLMEYATKDKHVVLPLEELKETLHLNPCSENVMFDRLLTLQQFREVVPDKYRIAFDDAFESLCSHIPDRKESKHGMNRNVYCALKKAFKPMIELILGPR